VGAIEAQTDPPSLFLRSDEKMVLANRIGVTLNALESAG